jgi:hypothetical protein
MSFGECAEHLRVHVLLLIPTPWQSIPTFVRARRAHHCRNPQRRDELDVPSRPRQQPTFGDSLRHNRPTCASRAPEAPARMPPHTSNPSTPCLLLCTPDSSRRCRCIRVSRRMGVVWVAARSSNRCRVIVCEPCAWRCWAGERVHAGRSTFTYTFSTTYRCEHVYTLHLFSQIFSFFLLVHP